MRLRWRPRSIRRQVAFGITLVTWLAVAQYSVFASPEDRAPAAAEELSRDLARAAARKDWDAAVAVARQLAAARPDSALDAYNLACMQSRAGHGEEAIAALTRSAELGFAYTSTLLRDEDLDAIRAQAGFNVALDRVRRNNAAALELAKPRLASAPLITFAPKRTPDKAPAAAPLPLIVALHGYGGTPEPIAEVYRASASRLGALLVVPRGQETVGRGFGWGVVEQAEYLVEQAIARTAAERPVGPIVLTGFSQGAGVALTMAARHPESYAGVVAVAGWFEERLAPLPERVPQSFRASFSSTASATRRRRTTVAPHSGSSRRAPPSGCASAPGSATSSRRRRSATASSTRRCASPSASELGGDGRPPRQRSSLRRRRTSRSQCSARLTCTAVSEVS